MRRDLRASEISHPNRIRNDSDLIVISTNELRRDLKGTEISHPNRIRKDSDLIVISTNGMRKDLKASEISHPNPIRKDSDLFFVISTNGMRRDLKVSENRNFNYKLKIRKYLKMNDFQFRHHRQIYIRLLIMSIYVVILFHI